MGCFWTPQSFNFSHIRNVTGLGIDVYTSPSTCNELWRLRISRDVFPALWISFICEHNFMHMTTCVYVFLKVGSDCGG